MITDHGWREYSIWEHSAQVRELYRRRCLLQAEEMTCAAQAAELLQPMVAPGDVVLDAGCGSGYFFHSLRKRGIEADYVGVDASETLIRIGRDALAGFGLDPSRLRVMRFDDLSGETDHVVCMNVLSNLDNYHRPLERFLAMARKSVILRESIGERSDYRYVVDQYLDDVELRVHVNTYGRAEIEAFIGTFGFDLRFVTDQRTRGEPEDVIGYPHRWTFAVATRQ